jgi:hypothetical protein
MRSFKAAVIGAVGCMIAPMSPALSQSSSSPPGSPIQPSPEELKQREDWRKSMSQHPNLKSGCFQAKFPSRQWEEVPCTYPPPLPLAPASRNRPFAVGNGSDFVANSPGTISSAVGSFWETDGLTSETGAGDAPNSFSLQLNTNTVASAACSTAANPKACQGVEQFVYTNGTGLFVQFWRINYGPNCPQGWIANAIPGTAQGCFKNSPVTSVPQQTIADLLNLSVTGSAQRNASDTVVLTTATGAYQASDPDSNEMLNISKTFPGVRALDDVTPSFICSKPIRLRTSRSG